MRQTIQQNYLTRNVRLASKTKTITIIQKAMKQKAQNQDQNQKIKDCGTKGYKAKR